MRIIIAITMGMLLGGCSYGVLDNRVVLDAGTLVTGCKGAVHGGADKFIELGARENGDFLMVETLRNSNKVTAACDDAQKTDPGMSLAPGDVLNVMLWSDGLMVKYGERGIDDGNLTTPTVQMHRIPIRHVPEEGGRLFDYESAFLSAVLSTQRAKDFGATNLGEKEAVMHFQALRKILTKYQVRLWNSLVSRMRIKRPQGTGGNEPTNPRLAMTLNMRWLCEDLRNPPDGGPPAEPEEVTRFMGAFLDHPPAAPSDCMAVHGHDDELFRVAEEHLSALHAVAGYPNGSIDEHHYYSKRSRYNLFNFGTIELNGVSVKHAVWPETMWSLTDWENSRICRNNLDDYPQITEVRIVDSPRTLEVFSPESGDNGTLQVRTTLYSDHNRRQVRRVIEPVSNDNRWPWVGPSLDHEQLDALTIRDVVDITWGDTLDPTVTVPPRCRF